MTKSTLRFIIKSVKRMLFVFIILATVIVLPQFSYALSSSTVLDDNQIEQIRNNCINTQATLARVHTSDALLRVNLGRQYDTLSTRLMAPFNSRAALNKLDVTPLVSTTTKFETSLDKFRTSYKNYEETVSSALQTDCKSHPVAFHDTVAEAQEKRKIVADSVTELNRLVAEYKTNFEQFAKEILNGK